MNEYNPTPNIDNLTPDDMMQPPTPLGCLLQILSLVVFLICTWLIESCSSTHDISKTDISTEYASYVEQEQSEVDSLRRVIARFDSVATSHEQKDSFYHNTIVTDTTILHDSTFVRELADGSRIEQYFHDKTRFISIHDTLWRDRKVSDQSALVQFLSDSLSRLNEKYESSSNGTDSIRTIIQYEDKLVVKSIPWYKQILMYMGGLLLVIILVTAIVYVIRRKA